MVCKTAKPLGGETFTAAMAIPKERFIGADGNLCVANAKAVGVSEYAAAIGEDYVANFAGILIVEAAGVINVGDEVVAVGTGANAGKAAAASALAATIALTLGAITATQEGTTAVQGGTIAAQSGSTVAVACTVDAGGTPVTSSAANGEIITTVVGAISEGVIEIVEGGIEVTEGAITVEQATSVAAATFTGGALPQKINGTALDAAAQDGDPIRILFAA